MGYEKPKTGAERVAKRRAALRAQGLRPKTIWVPDTRTPEFREQVRQECEIINAEYERDVELQRFLDANAEEIFASVPPLDDED